MYPEKEKIYPGYVSKSNSNREKQVILLMIPNREGWQWQYLGVKKLSTLLIGDFYCLNCLHSFKTKNKLELHKEVRENKDFCYVIMLSEDTTILEFEVKTIDKNGEAIVKNISQILQFIDIKKTIKVS